MKPLILVIDDDQKLNQLLHGFLGDFGFDVICATHPREGLQKLKRERPDLVILDVMLPEINGFEVCKTIRTDHTVPVIMLTARGEVMDRVVGLELGADDYLAKPFEPRELVARIQSVLRRSQTATAPPVTRRFDGLEIDYASRSATLDNVDLDLTTNEFNALKMLSSAPGTVFNRDQILQELRGMDCEAFNRSVDITMSRLRQKLGDDPRHPRYVKTIWGTGYAFIWNDPDV